MTIYLLKKTHLKTGLMYLCKTVQDPFKYKGSGKDWIPHLRQYGEAHTTEIVVACQSKEEFKYWGRYYSRLWNIVDAQDDYGNKIWANQKIEGGDGGSRPNPSAESRAKRSASARRANAITSEKRIKFMETWHGPIWPTKKEQRIKFMETWHGPKRKYKGKPPRSKEHCDNIRKALTGTTRSATTRAKMAAARLGRKFKEPT